MPTHVMLLTALLTTACTLMQMTKPSCWYSLHDTTRLHPPKKTYCTSWMLYSATLVTQSNCATPIHPSADSTAHSFVCYPTSCNTLTMGCSFACYLTSCYASSCISCITKRVILVTKSTSFGSIHVRKK